MVKLNESNSWKDRNPKGFGCISAFSMYVALMIAGKFLFNYEEEIVLICLLLGCGWGFYVFKRRVKSHSDVRKPIKFSIKKVLIIVFAAFLIGILGMLVFIEFNSESQGDEREDISSKISDDSIEQRSNLWYSRISDINNQIYELDRQWDELLEYENTAIGALSSFWDNTNKKQADIREKIRLLRKELPKDPVGKGKLAKEGRYLYARKHPSFESEIYFKVNSNDVLDLIHKSVSQNAIDLIKNDILFFDGSFQNAEDEAESILGWASNANYYIRNKKKKKKKEQELAKNTKKVSDLLKHFKKQYKEDWWFVRYEYQEGYIHSIQIKKSDENN